MLCHRFQYSKAPNNKNLIDFIHYYHYYADYCFQYIMVSSNVLGGLWLLMRTLLSLNTMKHFVTASHSGWRSHWQHKVSIKLLKSKRKICHLVARWLVGRVLSLENHEDASALQWWVLAQDSLGRSEQQDLHALLQLCNISLETMRRFISLSHPQNLRSSKFKLPMVLLAFFSAVFRSQTVCSPSSLRFLSSLLCTKA